jgi:uncharacterized protein DUF4350
MSRERWIQLAVLVGAIVLSVWIALNTYWTEVTTWTPMSGEALRNPYYAVTRLAAYVGVQPRMISSLDALPPNGIVLVNSLFDDMHHGSLESLQAWVQGGGRLIIRGNSLDASESLHIWSGIKQRKPEPHAKQPPPTTQLRAVQSLSEDCKPMAVSVDGVAAGRSLTLCDPWPVPFTSERVPSWSLADSNGIQVLRVPIGRGELTVIGPFMLLTNWGLTKGDHARIFLEAAGLKHGDRLDILSATRPEPLPALLWRLAAPAIVLLGIAVFMTIVRNLPRFGPALPAAAPLRRSLAEQLRANARFAWRTQKLASLRAAIRRSLDEAAERRIVGYALMVPRRRAEALSERTGIDPATITAALLDDSAGGVNEDRAAITLLDACRRILIQSDPNQRHHA